MKLLLEFGDIIQTVNQTRIDDFDGDIEVLLYGKKDKEKIKISDKQSKYILHKGDIIISAINYNNITISIIKENNRYIADNKYIVFRPNDSKYSPYLKIIIEKYLEKQRGIYNNLITNRTDLKEIKVDENKLNKFYKISELIIDLDKLFEKQYELEKNIIRYFKNTINNGEL